MYRTETHRHFAIGAVALIALASLFALIPSEESDGATDLGFYTSIDMPGGSEDEYYLGVNITDSGLLSMNTSKTIYVLAGSGIFISSSDTDDNWISYVDGYPYSAGVPSTIKWKSGYLSGTLESGDGIQVALYLTGHAWESYLTIVAVDDPAANSWPSSMTNLGNWDVYSDNTGNSSNLYTSMVFEVQDIGNFGLESDYTYDVYMATGSIVNIGCIDIIPFVNGSTIPGMTVDLGSMYGIINEPGNYRITIVDTSANVYINVHVIKVLKSFSVDFDSNGGSEVASQIIESGDCALSPEDPTLYGFTFKGWFTDNGTFQNEWDFTDPITGNMTLYAKWEGNLEFTTDPVADGKVTAVEGSPGTAVFAATGSQNYNTVLWDFGDGTTSTNTYVTHYYSQPGTYTATLTVYNNHGSDTMEFLIEVPGDDSGDGIPWTITIAAVLAVVIIGALIARYLL